MNYFDRVPAEFKPLLETSLALIPAKVREAIQPQFLCGISPHFVGLHNSGAEERDGRRQSDVLAHAHRKRDRWVIVYPDIRTYPDPINTVLHEYGHMYDAATGWQADVPETVEAWRQDRRESFAWLFELLLSPPSRYWRERCASEQMRPFRELIGVVA